MAKYLESLLYSILERSHDISLMWGVLFSTYHLIRKSCIDYNEIWDLVVEQLSVKRAYEGLGILFRSGVYFRP
jgi:hypothetical protein